MFFSPIHFPANYKNFILLYDLTKFHYMWIPHFLNPFIVVGHLGCFHSLAIVNSSTINMGVRVPWLEPDLRSLGIYIAVVLLDYMAGLFLVF
jgi:hypothetical protein